MSKYVDKEALNQLIMWSNSSHLTAHEAVKALQSRGFEDMTVNKYHHLLKKVKEESIQELAEYAKNNPAQHMERIQTLRFIHKERMRLLMITPDEKLRDKLALLRDIENMQPMLSAYHEISPHILPDKDGNTEKTPMLDLLKNKKGLSV